MRWLGGMLVAAVGAVLIVASPALAASQSVTAVGLQFSPSTVDVNQGDSVTWTNGGGFHDVVFDDGSFREPPAPSGSPWTVMRTFDVPGTFQYYCSVHVGAGMTGSVVVNANPTTGSGGNSAPAGTFGVQGQPTACKSQRNFMIRLRRPRGARIASAEVSVNGKPVKVSERVIGGKIRHVAPVDLRGLTKGTYKVDIVVTTDKGKKVRGTRSYQTCAAKLTSSALPPL